MLSTSRAERIFAILVCAIIAINVLFAFVGLNASSLWIDELYTYYFSDTALPSFKEVVYRSAEDVHPPLYYVAAHYIREITGGYEFPLRAFSAICACLAIAVIYWGTRGFIGWQGRLLGAGFALTAVYFYEYMQMARSNALSILLVAVCAIAALRILRRYEQRWSSWGLYLVLLITSIVGCFVHFYILILSGAIYAVLLLKAPRWSDRSMIVVSGLLVLAAFLPYLRWQLSQMVSTEETTWFESTLPFLLKHVRQYLGMQFGSRPMIALVIAVACILIVALAHVRWSRLRNYKFSPVVTLSVAVPVMTIVLGIFVSIAVAPSLSDRNLTLTAPFIWMLFAVLFDRALACLAVFERFCAFRLRHRLEGNPRLLSACFELFFRSPRLIVQNIGLRSRTFLLLASVLVLVLSSSVVLQRPFARQQEWRKSAAFVSDIEACRTSVIPVVAHDHNAISQREVDVFYRYYLAEPEAPKLLEVPRQALIDRSFAELKWRDLIERRLSGEDPCPILLWGVHHLTSWDLKLLDEAFKFFFARRGGKDIELYRFPHRMMRMGSPFTSDYRWCDDAFVFLTGPLPGLDPKRAAERSYSC